MNELTFPLYPALYYINKTYFFLFFVSPRSWFRNSLGGGIVSEVLVLRHTLRLEAVPPISFLAC